MEGWHCTGQSGSGFDAASMQAMPLVRLRAQPEETTVEIVWEGVESQDRVVYV